MRCDSFVDVDAIFLEKKVQCDAISITMRLPFLVQLKFCLNLRNLFIILRLCS